VKNGDEALRFARAKWLTGRADAQGDRWDRLGSIGSHWDRLGAAGPSAASCTADCNWLHWFDEAQRSALSACLRLPAKESQLPSLSSGGR